MGTGQKWTLRIVPMEYNARNEVKDRGTDLQCSPSRECFFFVFSRDETQRSGTQAEGNDVLQFWAVCNEGGSVNL